MDGSVDPTSDHSGGHVSNVGGCHEQGLNCTMVTSASFFSNLSATVVNLCDGVEAESQEVESNIIYSHGSSEQDVVLLGNGFVAPLDCANQNDLREEQILNSSVFSTEVGGGGRGSQNLEDPQLGFNEERKTLTTLTEKISNCSSPKAVSSEKVKTELELEVELFEAAEREEKTRLVPSSRFAKQGELTIPKDGVPVVQGLKNERKRRLDDTAADVCQVLPKKRGRRGHLVSSTKEEDDVCFVCFDGGELVLCDRRSCPKAYHLSCIGRDPAFFKKKGSWFCGWHFCCGCCRPANLQCYTCPKAYCVGCSKETGFLTFRKRKGLCDDCLPIIKMIESNGTVNADGVKVDFDDPDTYECLFKEYWEHLKAKFSLRLPNICLDGKTLVNTGELVEEGTSDMNDLSETEISSGESDEEVGMSDDKEAGGDKNNESGSAASRLANEDHVDDYDWAMESHEAVDADALGNNTERLLLHEFDGWASKDLLEFLMLMNHDPKISISRFQVNKLLWNYIKSNKLQNQQKRTIIECDEKLQKLFGKKSMHQYEMMKDIHLHFPPKGSSAKSTPVSRRRASNAPVVEKDLQRNVQLTVDSIPERLQAISYNDTPKLKRKYEVSEVSKVDSNEYAAIIPQNISLIYLRRTLLEDLLDDPEFETKVVGTFVRIRVPATSSKSEMCYRLVQVAGMKVQSQEYKTGKKTTNVVLEIMNLHKKENLTIDLVSNQDFTVEECHQLRQSVKCGFIRALRVGEIEQKTMSIREAKLNDWFETEALRLIALRDSANEKGCRKELRECIEKLQKLSDVEFRAKELRSLPVVIADLHMHPDYESEGNEEELNNDRGEPSVSGDGELGPGDVEKCSRPSMKEKDPAVHSSDRWNVDVAGPNKREWDDLKFQSTGWESWKTRDQSVRYSGEEPLNDRQILSSYKVEPSRWEDGKIGGTWGIRNEQEQGPALYDQRRTDSLHANWNNDQEGWKSNETHLKGGDMLNTSGDYGKAENSGWKTSNAMAGCLVPSILQGWAVEHSLTPSSAPTLPNSYFPAHVPAVVNTPIVEINEKEKLWHYQDPSGTIQGPFSMEQLKKWNLTGLFPLDLRIWKSNERSEESILLTDALEGRSAVNRSPGAAQAGIRGMSTPSYESDFKGAATSFRINERDTVHDPVSTKYIYGRRENGSYSMAKFGMEARPTSNGWGRDCSPNYWAANSRPRGTMHGRGFKIFAHNQGSRRGAGRTNLVNESGYQSSVVGWSQQTEPARGPVKDIPCRFHQKGYCRKGDMCPFRHD